MPQLNMTTFREIDYVILRIRYTDAMRRVFCDMLGAAHVA